MQSAFCCEPDAATAVEAVVVAHVVVLETLTDVLEARIVWEAQTLDEATEGVVSATVV